MSRFQRKEKRVSISTEAMSEDGEGFPERIMDHLGSSNGSAEFSPPSPNRIPNLFSGTGEGVEDSAEHFVSGVPGESSKAKCVLGSGIAMPLASFEAGAPATREERCPSSDGPSDQIFAHEAVDDEPVGTKPDEGESSTLDSMDTDFDEIEFSDDDDSLGYGTPSPNPLAEPVDPDFSYLNEKVIEFLSQPAGVVCTMMSPAARSEMGEDEIRLIKPDNCPRWKKGNGGHSGLPKRAHGRLVPRHIYFSEGRGGLAENARLGLVDLECLPKIANYVSDGFDKDVFMQLDSILAYVCQDPLDPDFVRSTKGDIPSEGVDRLGRYYESFDEFIIGFSSRLVGMIREPRQLERMDIEEMNRRCDEYKDFNQNEKQVRDGVNLSRLAKNHMFAPNDYDRWARKSLATGHSGVGFNEFYRNYVILPKYTIVRRALFLLELTNSIVTEVTGMGMEEDEYYFTDGCGEHLKDVFKSLYICVKASPTDIARFCKKKLLTPEVKAKRPRKTKKYKKRRSSSAVPVPVGFPIRPPIPIQTPTVAPVQPAVFPGMKRKRVELRTTPMKRRKKEGGMEEKSITNGEDEEFNVDELINI